MGRIWTVISRIAVAAAPAALGAMLFASLGCSICAAPDDCAYGAYGGKWQRHDMYHGRVGSAFGHEHGAVVEEGVIHEGEIHGEHYEGEVIYEGP